VAGREHLPLHVLGSGAAVLAAAPPAGFSEVRSWPEVLPEARDMLAPAIEVIAAGGATAAAEAMPDYVQPRIGWKTLAEQGRRA
jgi:tRNA threonylcarbamoyladenosine biosynthesis protein TsaB